MKIEKYIAVVCASFFLFFTQAEARPTEHNRYVTCVVIAVLNGNLFHCVDSKDQKHLIKMADIEAPELGQPYGPEAKEYLKELIYDDKIAVKIKGNRDGAILGELYHKKQNANREMIRKGLAWSDRNNKDSMYLRLERDAHSNGTGLWSDHDAVYPAVFREKNPTDIDALIENEATENTETAASNDKKTE
ncbi:MAG: thermonuclease family protein [Ruminobacter sp.]|uniref:thermonuclease family protein n=1 Tax=Ruminobacter sp. TaxID=2774296 RepID=UPI00257E8729|nr:thermonuclease family protein [Ruminobacter sp.]MBQ3774989.1 thermonuclease family protein [Ruminobacter sp.]